MNGEPPSNSGADERPKIPIGNQLDHVWSKTWNESLPSDPVEGVRFIQLMLEELETLGWPNKELFGIHMSLEEAIMNAIKHGNCLCDDKCVKIDARVSPDKLYIKVRDEGPGFDPDAVPDPTLEENLTKPSGRGVMLMRIYMTSVEYNESGNQVELLRIREHSKD